MLCKSSDIWAQRLRAVPKINADRAVNDATSNMTRHALSFRRVNFESMRATGIISEQKRAESIKGNNIFIVNTGKSSAKAVKTIMQNSFAARRCQSNSCFIFYLGDSKNYILLTNSYLSVKIY
jgi:hypothetical protein